MKNKKLGRPKSNNPKGERIGIRLTKEELEMLDYCCTKLGISKTEVIQKGVKTVYESIPK